MVVVCLLTLLVGCGDDDGSIPGEARISAGEGGTVVSDDGRLRLEIPPGALAEDTTIAITALPVPMDTGLRSWELAPDGLVFSVPASSTLRLTNEDIGLPPDSTDLLNHTVMLESTDLSLEAAGNIAITIDLDTAEHVITSDIPHFTRFRQGPSGVRYTYPITVDAQVGRSTTATLELRYEPRDFFGTRAESFLDQLKTIEVIDVQGPITLQSPMFIEADNIDPVHRGAISESNTLLQTNIRVLCDEEGMGEVEVKLNFCTNHLVTYRDGAWLTEPFETETRRKFFFNCVNDLPPRTLICDDEPVSTESLEMDPFAGVGMALLDALLCDDEGPTVHNGMPKPPAGDETEMTATGAALTTLDAATAAALDALPPCAVGTDSPAGCAASGGGAALTPGPIAAVAQVLAQPLPLADIAGAVYQYAIVADTDGQPANNYEAPMAFPDDFFQGSDRQWELLIDEAQGVRLQVRRAAGGTLEIVSDSGARAFIIDDVIVYIIPADEIVTGIGGALELIWRTTTFRHLGDFGLNPPFVWEADVEPTVGRGFFDLFGGLVVPPPPPMTCLTDAQVPMRMPLDPTMTTIREATICPAPFLTMPLTCPDLVSGRCSALAPEVVFRLDTSASTASLTVNATVITVAATSHGTLVGSDRVSTLPLGSDITLTVQQGMAMGTLTFRIDADETLTILEYDPPYPTL